MRKTKTPSEYFNNTAHWQAEIKALRQVLQVSELKEEIKWGAPCYTYMGKNVAGLGAYQHYFGLWFHQGVLLSDPHHKLMNAQGGITKALRQWRMTSLADIDKETILAYIQEAIGNVESGKSIAPNRNKPLVIPDELLSIFATHAELKTAFDKLTLSKKREYTGHISTAKQIATKQCRLDKIIPMIITGVGLHDKYR